jgi:hypothetical protein
MIQLNLNAVNKLDLTHLLEKTESNQTKEYIIYPQGEHYKFLAYLTSLFDNIIIFDIGTHHGGSALALAENQSNQIISYDIYKQCKLILPISNIEINIGDAAKDERLKYAKIILLDTVHDGLFEKEFIAHLLNINFKGILILDDIFFNEEMKELWNSIDLPKFDLSYAAHFSGTGLVDFDNNANIIHTDKWKSDRPVIEYFHRSPVETIQNELMKTSIPGEIQTYILKCIILKDELEKKMELKFF